MKQQKNDDRLNEAPLNEAYLTLNIPIKTLIDTEIISKKMNSNLNCGHQRIKSEKHKMFFIYDIDLRFIIHIRAKQQYQCFFHTYIFLIYIQKIKNDKSENLSVVNHSKCS